MIGKPEWFTRRKYGGWGLMPKTWQGWIYIALIILPFVVFQSIPFWEEKIRLYVTIGWLAFLLLDVFHIMITMKNDEREKKIESIAERNAAWTMVMLLIAGILYQAIRSGLNQKFGVDIFLVIALFGGLIVKAASNIYLERTSL